MDLGTIYHRFMKEGPGSEDIVRNWVREKQAVLEHEAANQEDPDDALIKHINELTDLYHKAEVMATIYWEKYPRGEDRETLAREQHIVVDDVEGTVDEIELYLPSGQVSLRDTKTTGDSLDAILTGYQYGLQLRTYRYLAEEWCRENGHPEPSGFIIDAVLMPTIKLCKKDLKQAKIDGCTPETAYLLRVEQWYEDNCVTAMTSVPMKFTEPVMTEELDHAFETIRELAGREPDPRNYKKDVTGSYCMYFKKQCPFYSLCKIDPSMWPVELDEHYEIWETEGKGEL
jgi:hypothetical protein